MKTYDGHEVAEMLAHSSQLYQTLLRQDLNGLVEYACPLCTAPRERNRAAGEKKNTTPQAA